MNAGPATNDKEVTNLREEVHLLRRNIEDMKKKHENDIANERLLAEKRIMTYVDSQKLRSEGSLDKVSIEFENYSFKVSCLEEELRSVRHTLEDRDRNIDLLTAENASLKS